jgi:signal transduction histidine kinase/ActR/RegA family two-component response regulator
MLDDCHFETICHDLDDGLLILQDGCPVYANRALAAMVGSTVAQMLAVRADAYLEMDLDPEGRRTLYTAAGGAMVKTASRLRGYAGTWIDVEISGRMLQLNRGFGERLVIRESGKERQRIAQELQKARQLESIAALSGGIAHDYNNLLTAIMGNISLCLTSLDATSPLHGWLNQAQDAALIAKELTNRLITFSKGGSPLKETVNPADLVEGATAFALSGSNLEAFYDLAEDLWPIDVDRMQVGQAIHNIVINAREAMPHGGRLTITARNAMQPKPSGAQSPGRQVVISIIDNGRGIAPALIHRIFDPYFSAKEMGEERGLGLGLSIANSIIEKHGGTIGVTSEPGQGACFSLYLPASKNVITVKQQEDTRPMKTNGSQTGRILVMDDEEMIRNLAGNILTRLGYEPSFARHGDEAIEQYQEALAAGRPYDAVILDLTVKGGMGGKETIQKLVALDPAVRGIVSSGYANDPGVVNYRDYGFCAAVAKPYRIKEISDQLEQLLGRREGHGALADHQPNPYQ